jgi:hypothetical protein
MNYHHKINEIKNPPFKNSYADTFHGIFMRFNVVTIFLSYPLALIKDFDMRKGRENKMVTMLWFRKFPLKVPAHVFSLTPTGEYI